MLINTKIKNLLRDKTLLWIGGGYHLALPTLAPFLCGGITFSSDKSSNTNIDSAFLFNLENLCPKRPDWNRFTDSQIYDLLPRDFDDNKLKAWADSIVFPYYVSSYAWQLAEMLGVQVIGNSPIVGEALYIRQNARAIATEAGMTMPHTVRYTGSNIPSYSQLTSAFNCLKLVLTPPYSDGGAWVYPVTGETEFLKAVSDICHHFPDDYIEVTPYYEGVSMNLNICNIVEPDSFHCHVVVYPPSVQIIGEPSLSDGKLRYCGCDFQAASEIMENIDSDELFSLATRVGKTLFRNYGWKGMFGIDFILRPDGTLVFLEINPRLQSSTHTLDVEFRDDWNPMLLQIAVFLGKECGIRKDINLMNRSISSSMLIAYNGSGDDLLTVSPYAKHPGISGLPVAGKVVAPGAILFRQSFQERILGPDLHTLKANRSMAITDQINSTFTRTDSISVYKTG